MNGFLFLYPEFRQECLECRRGWPYVREMQNLFLLMSQSIERDVLFPDGHERRSERRTNRKRSKVSGFCRFVAVILECKENMGFSTRTAPPQRYVVFIRCKPTYANCE